MQLYLLQIVNCINDVLVPYLILDRDIYLSSSGPGKYVKTRKSQTCVHLEVPVYCKHISTFMMYIVFYPFKNVITWFMPFVLLNTCRHFNSNFADCEMGLDSFIHSLILSTNICWVFTTCPRHCSRPWGYSREWDRVPILLSDLSKIIWLVHRIPVTRTYHSTYSSFLTNSDINYSCNDKTRC